MAFLAERGFSLDDAQKFGVGYSPNAWDEPVSTQAARLHRGGAAQPNGQEDPAAAA